MKIISFAWTSGAFEAGRKTVTRRRWKDIYAKLFKAGDICQAYDKSPRCGGKRIGYLRIESVTEERMRDMPDSDFEAEGFAFLEEIGATIWGMPPREAFDWWRRQDEEPYVVRFRIVEILGK